MDLAVDCPRHQLLVFLVRVVEGVRTHVLVLARQLIELHQDTVPDAACIGVGSVIAEMLLDLEGEALAQQLAHAQVQRFPPPFQLLHRL